MTGKVIAFPKQRRVRIDPQPNRLEFWFSVLHGLPPEKQKSIVIDAYAYGLIDPQDVEIFIGAYGLESA